MLTKLRGGRMQAHVGGKWVQNDMRRDLGIDIEICPVCRRFNPYSVGTQTAPLRCHACAAPLYPPCPTHGEAACYPTCRGRPCSACYGDGPLAPFVDPMKLRQGLLCRKCGRDARPAEEQAARARRAAHEERLRAALAAAQPVVEHWPDGGQQSWPRLGQDRPFAEPFCLDPVVLARYLAQRHWLMYLDQSIAGVRYSAGAAVDAPV